MARKVTIMYLGNITDFLPQTIIENGEPILVYPERYKRVTQNNDDVLVEYSLAPFDNETVKKSNPCGA